MWKMGTKHMKHGDTRENGFALKNKLGRAVRNVKHISSISLTLA